MLASTQPFTEDFAFIRSCSDVWKTQADAAAGFADGWSIMANGLRFKGALEEDACKAAQMFTDAAWVEWCRGRT